MNKTARIAGLFYLLYMITTIGADVFGRSKLIVFGDAAATAANITGTEHVSLQMAAPATSGLITGESVT